MPDRPSSADRPLVTAVIPTRGRPELLTCAVRSALRQTWSHLEVLVVVDGPDAPTEASLAALSDPRLRVVILPQPSGGSAARNTGVEMARGDWIAFLDDDDEWLPQKIERQMEAVAQTKAWFPIVACRVIAQSSTGSRVLPARIYQPPQAVADYLFCRDGLLDSGGIIQSSTLLAPRDLLRAVPFQAGLPLHQDWDWLIRASAHEGVELSMLPQPLSVWRIDDHRAHLGQVPDWKFSLSWIRSLRPLLAPRTFSSFVAVQCAWRAQQSRAGILPRLWLLHALLVEGSPNLAALLHFLIFAFIPMSLRRALCGRFRTVCGFGTSPGLRLVCSRQPLPAVLRRTSS